MPAMGIMPAATWGRIAHVKLDFFDLLQVPINVRCYSNRDIIVRRSEVGY